MSEIEDLHDALFGHRPAKHGTAYERVTAVVLAALGWTNVQHDRREKADGKLAVHQLDVTARDPGGVIERIIVECKDKDPGRKFDKGTMDKLVGVMTQLNVVHGMAVTTVGFTSGAIKVAVDNNIARVRIRPYDPSVRYIQSATIKFAVPLGNRSDLTPILPSDETLPAGAWLSEFDVLTHLDGSEAEYVTDILEQNAGALVEDEPQLRTVMFEGSRLLERDEGDPIPLVGISWTESLFVHHQEITVGSHSEPRLIVDHADASGTFEGGKVMVDDRLLMWDIDSENNVTPRGHVP